MPEGAAGATAAQGGKDTCRAGVASANRQIAHADGYNACLRALLDARDRVQETRDLTYAGQGLRQQTNRLRKMTAEV